MIDLPPEQLQIIRDILLRCVPDCEVRAFGSRVKQTASLYSDLDLAIVGKESLDWRQLEALKDAFASSNLPIMVDVHDWHILSDNFQNIINEQYEIIQSPGFSA